MSDSPLEEAPVYHRSLTPESPRPLHVPSPANIPILENQIEPIYNLISSHTEPPYAARDLTHMDQELAAAVAAADATLNSDNPFQNLDSNEANAEIEGMPTNIIDASLPAQETDITAQAPSDQDAIAQNTDAAALNNDDPLAAIANSSSHAANLSTSLQSENQPAEPALPPTSTESAQDNATAQADVPSLEPDLTAPSNVAEDGMSALLASLSAPRNMQIELTAIAPGVSEHPSTTTIEPQQTQNDEMMDGTTANDATDSSALPQQTGIDQIANMETKQPTMVLDVAQNQQALSSSSALPPPPGLVTSLVPGMNGVSSLPMASPPQTSGAPGVPSPGVSAAPGTSNPPATAGGGSLDAKYSSFLDEESVFTAEGAWEKFPHGSRLFVGNLPTEAVTKREIWDIFEKYGKLAQISIKQAYGFVQFMDVDACQRAMNHEQGARIKERNMHLEVSKPPKSSRNTQTTSDGDRLRDRHRRNRSRSPERRRGQRGGQQNRNLLYSDFRDEPRRGRDDYRPGRSPSPRRRGDDYRPGRDRSSDRYYDGRRRSRSPYNRGSRRSPSPRRSSLGDDDLPLPRRSPRDVPDVQIILLESVPGNFVDFVVRGFRNEGMRVDVLNMPRVPIDAVIRRQIVEGVLAVCKLTRTEEQTGKVPLQVFDRSQGSQNVRFDEYDNLQMDVAAKLAARAKASAAPATPTYSSASAYVPPYMQQVQPPQPPSLANNPQLQQLITTLDGPALQQLLSAMGQQQGTPTQLGFPQQGASAQPDMSSMLGSLQAPQQHAPSSAVPQSYQYPQQATGSQQAQYGYPAASTFQAQQSNAAYPTQGYGQSPQDPNQVQSIMQQLAGIQRKG